MIKRKYETDLVELMPEEFSPNMTHGIWEAMKWSYNSSVKKLDEIHKEMERDNDAQAHFRLCLEEQLHLGVMSVVKGVNETIKKLRSQ